MLSRKSTFRKGNVIVEITRSNSEICLVSNMKINGIPAYVFDFGIMKDVEPEKAPHSGCGNRRFIPKKIIATHVLYKYNLTEDDAEDLKDILEKELSIGYCKRCR